MSETIYPKGVTLFSPRDGAPEWVVGEVIITIEDLKEFVNDNPDLLSEYKGKKQLKLNILRGKKGLYATVNTYKPKPKGGEEDDGKDPLPF